MMNNLCIGADKRFVVTNEVSHSWKKLCSSAHEVFFTVSVPLSWVEALSIVCLFLMCSRTNEPILSFFFFWFVSFSFFGGEILVLRRGFKFYNFFSRTLSRWENETDGKTWFWLTARVLHEVDARIKRASSTLTFLYCRKKERKKKLKRLNQNSLVFGNSPFLAILFSSPKPFDP